MNRVLVVDDEPGMRAALRANFLQHGWGVDTASGAAEAMAAFRRGCHPLVVTDIRMPDGDGFGVMRAVRALAPSTAVILLTAFSTIPDATAARFHLRRLLEPFWPNVVVLSPSEIPAGVPVQSLGTVRNDPRVWRRRRDNHEQSRRSLYGLARQR